MNLHGGIIAATSDGPGTGATFTVELPVVRIVPSSETRQMDAMTMEPNNISEVHEPSVGDGLAVRNVFVVDDAPLNRKMLCRC